jgi:hypothetical protein
MTYILIIAVLNFKKSAFWTAYLYRRLFEPVQRRGLGLPDITGEAFFRGFDP